MRSPLAGRLVVLVDVEGGRWETGVVWGAVPPSVPLEPALELLRRRFRPNARVFVRVDEARTFDAEISTETLRGFGRRTSSSLEELAADELPFPPPFARLRLAD